MARAFVMKKCSIALPVTGIALTLLSSFAFLLLLSMSKKTAVLQTGALEVNPCFLSNTNAGHEGNVIGGEVFEHKRVHDGEILRLKESDVVMGNMRKISGAVNDFKNKKLGLRVPTNTRKLTKRPLKTFLVGIDDKSGGSQSLSRDSKRPFAADAVLNFQNHRHRQHWRRGKVNGEESSNASTDENVEPRFNEHHDILDNKFAISTMGRKRHRTPESRKNEGIATIKRGEVSTSEAIEIAASEGEACPVGSICDSCTRNFFGPDCDPCPVCHSSAGEFQGRCDDGQLGTGLCMKASSSRRQAFSKCHNLSRPCPLSFHQTPGDLVMTTIFTSKLDPQRPGYRANCSVSDTNWYRSVRSLGLSALVLHDCLSEREVVQLQTQYVRFLRVKLRANMSVNDVRFIFYFGILSGQVHDSKTVSSIMINAKWIPTVQKVFMTDMLDVRFTGNPFDLVYGEKYHLYVGSEDNASTSPPSGGWSSWMKQLAFNCSGWDEESILSHQTNIARYLLNAGIVGGTINPVLKLLRLMSLHMLSSKAPVRSGNCDMFVLNKCVHDLFAIESIFTGYPLHSVFKGQEASSNAYIIHK